MPHLRVKHWVKFQHYKRRRPPWIKLHHDLLDDYDFCSLPIECQALAPRLWLIASEFNADGEIQLSNVELAFRLRMAVDELQETIDPLLDAGFLESADSSAPAQPDVPGKTASPPSDASGLLADCKQDASNLLAFCKQHATPETETETETETNPPIVPPSEGGRKRVSALSVPQMEKFTGFWAAYPSKVGRGAAEQAFSRVNPDDALMEKILAAIKRQKGCDRWKRNIIPNPRTWLNQRRWEDEPAQSAEGPGRAAAPALPKLG